MAMTAGDSTCASGTMARAIYDAFEAAWGSSDPGTSSDDALREMAAAIAAGVVGHITGQAAVTVTIGTGDGALQRDPDTDRDTLAPGSARTLGGTIA